MVTVVESPKQNSVHYPSDRRFQAWVRRDLLLLFVGLAIRKPDHGSYRCCTLKIRVVKAFNMKWDLR